MYIVMYFFAQEISRWIILQFSLILSDDSVLIIIEISSTFHAIKNILRLQ